MLFDLLLGNYADLETSIVVCGSNWVDDYIVHSTWAVFLEADREG